MFLEGLTIHGFYNNNNSNSAQESNPIEESNGSSIDFSPSELDANKKMAQYELFHVHIAAEEVFKQSHMIDRKTSTQQTQNEHK